MRLVACLVALACAGLLTVSECRAGVESWGTSPEVARGPEDDWAFSLTDEARDRLHERRGVFSCATLEEYIRANDPWAAFYSIRDAALFEDRACAASMEKLRKTLDQNPLTRIAVQFYLLKQGDSAAMQPLLKCFDEQAIAPEGGRSVDHVVVSLFGFLPDWDQTGRRLLRHAAHADGAATTINANALEWKKELFGKDPRYRSRCEQAAAIEGLLGSRVCNG